MTGNYSGLTPYERQAVKLKVGVEREKRRRRVTAVHSPIWQPNPDHPDRPNTQRLALESQADILGLSGTAGWGKSHLALGLAATQHYHSVIFRRIFKNLRGLIEDSRVLFNADGRDHLKDSFNESLHRWSLDGGRMIEFEAMQYEHDKFNQRGRPRDLFVFDEATEFSRSQVEFSLGWMRSARPGQRCRALFPFNPPTDENGVWVIDYFLPWIAYLFPDKFQHPNPAAPGELRWYATIDGKEVECQDGRPFDHKGEMIRPLSRSFLFGTLEDNPYLRDTNYATVLQSMPEPLRSQLLYGDFAATSKANRWQVIPTAWVQLAQRRWMESEKPNIPLSGVGVDLVRGGKDAFALAKRFGWWFAEVMKVPGVNVEDGPAAAGLMFHALEDEKHIGYITMDIIGVGSSGYDSAKVMWPGKVYGLNVAEGSSYVAMSKTNPPAPLFRMKNKRAEMYWRMREALDPANGKDYALPPGNELLADLCAARYEVLAGGVIQIEKKEAIKERLGRSPDVGEAVLLSDFAPTQAVEVMAHGRAKGWNPKGR